MNSKTKTALQDFVRAVSRALDNFSTTQTSDKRRVQEAEANLNYALEHDETITEIR